MQQPSPNGWVNKYEIGEAISLFFEQNLISKYLQHFPILTWNEENTKITFEGGVVSELIDGQMVVTRNGKPVAYCDVAYTSSGELDVRADSLVFVPWDPITEDKIYHWNPDGGATTWQLPDTWDGLSTVALYQTTENGKIRIGELPVSNGSVSVKAEANTPYVIYKNDQDAGVVETATEWSENSAIKDTGFDAQVYVDQNSDANGNRGRWARSSEDGSVDHIGFEKDIRWNNLAVVNSAKDAVISQKITGLTPGKDYSISVWALIENDDNRMVVLGAESSDGSVVESYLTKTDVGAVKNKFQYTNFRRMRIILEADETGTATVYLRVGAGSNENSKVKFDDVRIWEHVTDTPQKGHYYFDDFENVDFSLGALEHDTWSNDNVHLADEHPDFNNGAAQYLSYVIDGRYSAKINDTATPVGNSILRPHPSVLRFQPETTYRVSIDYYTPVDGAYKLVAKDSAGNTLAELPLPKNGEVYAIGEDGKQMDPAKRKPVGTTVSFEFSTGADENCYISLVKTAEAKNHSTTYLILDNFVVDDLTPVDKTELTKLYDANKDKTNENYTDESWNAFQEALKAAKAVLDNENATQKQVDAAKAALETAVAGLTEKKPIEHVHTPSGWVYDKTNHWRVCTGCGEELEKRAHEWSLSSETKTEKVYSCDICGATKTEKVEQPVDPDRPIIVVPTKPGAGSGNEKKFPFADVSKYDDCYDAVKYLYEYDIMNGTSDTLFSPNAELTRAMVVTILYRMEGEPFTTGAKTFSDVADGLWYTKAVEWAAENDIVNGFTDGTFKPEQAVTREQLAAILSRYASFNGIVIYEPTDALASTDIVSSWAKKDVAWAAAEGILTPAQTANATKNANRAEVAMAIYTYLTKTAK